MGRLYNLTGAEPQEEIEALVASEMAARHLTGEELGRRTGMDAGALRARIRKPGHSRDLKAVRRRMAEWLNSLDPIPVDYGGSNEADMLAKFAMSSNAGQSMAASFEGIYRELVAIRKIMAANAAAHTGGY